MPEHMTATELIYKQIEWDKEWNKEMLRLQERLTARVLKIIARRDLAGWPTSGNTGDAEC